MQRVPNYGSFLQAWALKEILRGLGAEVSFIDIVPGRQLPGRRATMPVRYWNRLWELTGALFTGRLGAKMRERTYHRTMRARYITEYYAMLGLDRPAPERYDLAVIGSDQVFNCLERSSWGFTTQLFGDIPQADRVVSYAASFGETTAADLRRAGVADEVATNLLRLAAISVRDDNSREVVRELTGRDAQMHLDPVLVYDFSAETTGLTTGRKDYIVVYSYVGRISDKAEVAAIVGFARSHGKRLVSIFTTYDWCDEAVIPQTPFEVLTWFREADYIVTDTFHGTVFSVVTRSRFCTLVRPSNVKRLTSLLQSLGLRSRIASTPRDIAGVLDAVPDYTAAAETIRREKTRTREYLTDSLKPSQR